MLLSSTKHSFSKFIPEFSFPLVCDILLSYCWSQQPFNGSFCRIIFLHPPSLYGIDADLSTDKGSCLIAFSFACLSKKWVNFSQFEFSWECKKDIPFPEPVTKAIIVTVGSGYFSLFEINVLIEIVCERHLFCSHCDAVNHRYQTLILILATYVLSLLFIWEKRCLLFQTSHFTSQCLFTSFVYLDSYLSYVRNCLSFSILYCAQHDEVSFFPVSSGMAIIQIMNSSHLYLRTSSKTGIFMSWQFIEAPWVSSFYCKHFDLFW